MSSIPTPTPGPAASCHLLLPSCITESPQALNPLLRLRTGASEESICSLYSGLDPPRGGPKGPGSRSPEEGLCFLTALRGCRQTSFLRSPPASEPAADSSRDQSLCPHLFLVPPRYAPPPQLRPTHPQAPLLKAGPLSDGGSGSPGGWGRAGHTESDLLLLQEHRPGLRPSPSLCCGAPALPA